VWVIFLAFEHLKPYGKPLSNFFLFSLKFNLALAFALFTYTMFFSPLWLLPYVGAVDAVWVLAIWGGLTGFILLAWRNATTRAGLLFSLPPLAYCWFLTDYFFIRTHAYEFFSSIGALGWVLIFLTTMVLCFSGLILIGASVRRYLSRFGVQQTIQNIRLRINAQRGLLVLSLGLILVCGSYVGITIQSYPRGTVTIVPQNYQVHFAFWAITDPSNYTTPELQEMNEYKVTLVGGMPGVGDLLTGSPTSAASDAAFIQNLTWWNNTWPGITFSITIPGIPGGYWDGSANETTQQCKAVLELAMQNNLTNVIGETYDWEIGTLPPNSTLSQAPNATLHQQAIQTWNNFFDWKDQYAPFFKLTVINDVYLYFANITGDMNMNVYRQELSYEVPRFDEYAPGVYRCFFTGAKPYGDPTTASSAYSIEDTYSMYETMLQNAETVNATFGNSSKLGVYLGETNCSCYGADTQVYENGVYQGTGWDMLVRDSLICKAFGPQTITYFLLFTAPSGYGWIMGGMFESYGEDFLEKLNDAVNGVNSTQPFTIQQGPVYLAETGFPNDDYTIYLELLYNLNDIVAFAGTVVVVIAIGLSIYFVQRRRHSAPTEQ
jgi:hypothetical protein